MNAMLWLGLLSFALTFAALRLLLWRFPQLALDQPNERSLHQRAVPRSGGIALLLGAAPALALGAGELWRPFALALALAALSFADDLRGVPTALRLAAHFAAAGALAWYLLTPMDAWKLALLVVSIVWLTNLYNFMDGADGVAGGMGLVGFGAYAAAAWSAGHASLAALSAALAAASAAFLLHNFHPARIFLGDVGAIALGFLAAGLGLQGWRDDVWPLWFPVLVFGPFAADTTITVLRRALRRERVWLPHQDFYFQRMVRMGLGHRRTACTGYVTMLFCAGAALYARTEAPTVQVAAFAAGTVFLAALALWVDLRWARFRRASGSGSTA